MKENISNSLLQANTHIDTQHARHEQSEKQTSQLDNSYKIISKYKHTS